jgi:hypothetical protein
MTMPRLFLVTGALLYSATVAVAQSSGNFAAKIDTVKCVIDDNNDGVLTGGITAVTSLATTIKTPNAGSTALVIRPSFVTGLYTKTKLTSDGPISTATAIAGVKVRVLIDGKIVAPGTPVGLAPALPSDGWVYYDKRFQQLSSNLFNSLAVDCDAVLDGIQPCELQLILSTLSAHSLDFVVGGVGGGIHDVKVEWTLEANDSNQAACVGPGVLTVTQVKTFSQGGGIVID